MLITKCIKPLAQFLVWCFLNREIGQFYHLLVIEYPLELLVLLHDAQVVLVLEPVATFCKCFPNFSQASKIGVTLLKQVSLSQPSRY